MIDVAKKRMPKILVLILVYISYCAADWYTMRGDLAYYCEQYSFPTWLSNDIFAFFIGGLISFLLYVIISNYVTKTLTIRLCGKGDVSAIQYGIHLTIACANVLIFLISLIYLAAPLVSAVVSIISSAVITLGLVALYLWYAFKQEYIKKCYFKQVFTTVFGFFLCLYALKSLILIITAVVA